ncbi:MAG TPA: type II toxin-antitoxin system HipA family toxin [Thermoleophilaceae bacterium]|nr:type II toxin-antitoxin system HipA family toxin [Thermoleophilaceae bacterium]
MRALDVWLYGRRAGRLEQVDGRMRFTYAADYVDAGGAPLSCSLPLGAREHDREAEAFFANLLPEGEARTLVARRLGVSAGNDFGLLYEIGGDCAGAVTLLPPGASPDDLPAQAEVRWLDESELAAALDELPRRPLLADPDEGIRLSLAGAQDKLPVVVRDGRIGIPLGRTPSTHIVKTPIVRFDDTVANEALCLELARSLGLSAASAEVRDVVGREFLLVERYDRRHAPDGRVERIHQEDFCQALAIPPQLKYESEGGPGLADCFGVLLASSNALGPDRLALVDAVTLNFLIGNHDAHGKNFSLLLEDGGTRLAPLYDLVSTAVYPGLDRKMAMAIGGEYRPDYVRRRHVDRFSQQTRRKAAPVRRRMLRLAERARAVAPEAVERVGPRPVLDRVLETVAQRAGWLERELA